MTNEDIKKIIDALRNRKNCNEGYIGFFQYGGDTTESYIKANREGLELYAAEFLEAALEIENKFETGKLNTYRLDEGITDYESDYIFDYIELTNKSKKDILPNANTNDNWKDRAFKVGCIGVGIILVFLLLVGLNTVIGWI